MIAQRTALLLIDIQRGMFGPQEVCHGPEALLASCRGLLDRARAAAIPVVHVQHCETEGPLQHGGNGWQIHDAVAPRAGEPVVAKWACSAFYRTNLHDLLAEAGVGRLAIAGLQTEFCIDTACRVAQSLGYAVTLAGDGHSTFDSPGLAAAAIIAHHNRVLAGIVDRVMPASDIVLVT